MSEEIHTAIPDRHHEASANTVFGFWLYLMTDSIMFATFFATYAVLLSNHFPGPTPRELFSLPYALGETFVLLGSSFTTGIAMTALQSGNKKKLAAWYGGTFVLGLIFLCLVGYEFTDLILKGDGWQKNGVLSAYFTLVGAHAVHIVFGLLFLLGLVRQALRWGIIPMTIRRLTCLKIFWFYSYFIWIFMFAIIYLIGVK